MRTHYLYFAAGGILVLGASLGVLFGSLQANKRPEKPDAVWHGEREAEYVPRKEAEPCPEGSWADHPHDMFRCVPWTKCPAGSYAIKEPTPTSDSECAVVGGESGIPTGYTPTLNVLASPLPYTDSAPGSMILHFGNATHDRTIIPCNSSLEFSTEVNATECVPFSVCVEAGTGVSVPGTATSDLECGACPDGTFSLGNTLEACQPHTVCGDHTYKTANGTNVTDTTCIECPAGYGNVGTSDAASCVDECGSGTFNDGSTGGECVAATPCPPGTEMELNYTSSQDYSCDSCAAGASFTNASNMPFCTPCDTCSGSSVNITCNITTDSVCN